MSQRTVLVPQWFAGGSFPCYATAPDGGTVEQPTHPTVPMYTYDYSKRQIDGPLVRELLMECPTCHGGLITMEVAEDRKTVLTASHYDCPRDCSILRYQGGHDAEQAAALKYANDREDAGPAEIDYDRADLNDTAHQMAQARRVR